MPLDREYSDGQFFFVQWEGIPAFVHCSWRTDIAAVNETLHNFLHCCPSRLIVLKMVQASLEDEKRLTTHINDISSSKWLASPCWRENNAALQAFIRELPCATRQARAIIGRYKGRLLWRPGGDEKAMPTAKEVIIDLLGRSQEPCAPSTLHALPGAAIPLQTIYNTLGRLLAEGMVRRPEQGLYELTEQGEASYAMLIKPRAPRKSVRSLSV
jgi:predicted transcriptional regulator